MQAFRSAATISDNGELTLRTVPFRPGSRVEVIVLEEPTATDLSSERRERLQAARGIWKERSDLPDFKALRDEFDRSLETDS